MTILQYDAIEQAVVHTTPYPYFVAKNTIAPECSDALHNHFPNLPNEGLMPAHRVTKQHRIFDKLLEELASTRLRRILEKKLDLTLPNVPPLITVRSRARLRDGKIHTDTPDKCVSLLLYLNQKWEHTSGALRVLNNHNDINNYVTEIPPLMGHMFVFKVTDNCWHGHQPLQSQRRAIMLNYMRDEAAYQRHFNKHNTSARWKTLKKKMHALLTRVMQ